MGLTWGRVGSAACPTRTPATCGSALASSTAHLRSRVGTVEPGHQLGPRAGDDGEPFDLTPPRRLPLIGHPEGVADLGRRVRVDGVDVGTGGLRRLSDENAGHLRLGLGVLDRPLPISRWDCRAGPPAWPPCWR